MSGPKSAAEILIVEDSRTQAEFLRYKLERHGYRARCAASGQEALQMLSTWSPELVISDINMPGMDGYQLCRAIKFTEATAYIPVILLTSLSDPQDILRGLECGADSFISKPYDEIYLLERIRQLLESRSGRPGSDLDESSEVLYEGQLYLINASRQQMLDLLLSIYETAMLRNIELLRTRDQLTKAYDELNQIATSDELTGLYNRRELNRLLREEVERNRRYGRPMAMILFDIDHFKNVNDTYGHQVGDQVLRTLGSFMVRSVRSLDRAARYGGEEIAVLLPETTSAQAVIVAEHLRQQLEELPIVCTQPDGRSITVHVTVSAGVAAIPESASTEEELISASDQALYRAKREGRNRVLPFVLDATQPTLHQNGIGVS